MKFLLTVFLMSLIFSCSKKDSRDSSLAKPTVLTEQDKILVEKEFKVDLSNFEEAPVPLAPTDQKNIEKEVNKDCKELKELAKNIDTVVARIINHAAIVLKSTGHEKEAVDLLLEYKEYAFIVERTYFIPKDLGDHKPLTPWLDEVYVRLENILGPELMKVTRLTDIKIINYAVPVVFQPRGTSEDKWDINEYRLHFVPLAGASAYWAVWGTCVGVTNGVGAVTFICMKVGEESRAKIETEVAPTVSDVVYKEANL